MEASPQRFTISTASASNRKTAGFHILHCCAARDPPSGRPSEHQRLAQGQLLMIGKRLALTTQRRKIEVFTAGCPCCTEAVELIEFLAGNEHDVEIRDMHDPTVAAAARAYGIRRVPAVVIDGRLADFYAARDLDEVTLTQAIFG